MDWRHGHGDRNNHHCPVNDLPATKTHSISCIIKALCALSWSPCQRCSTGGILHLLPSKPTGAICFSGLVVARRHVAWQFYRRFVRICCHNLQSIRKESTLMGDMVATVVVTHTASYRRWRLSSSNHPVLRVVTYSPTLISSPQYSATLDVTPQFAAKKRWRYIGICICYETGCVLHSYFWHFFIDGSSI